MDESNRRLSDEEEMSEVIIKPFEYFEQTVNQKIHHFYLSGGIEEPHHYVKMIHTIITAPSQDAIYIHLNTPGGYLDTGIQLINAMQSSDATIIASLDGCAHSLGSLIFLAADQWIVHDNTLMMIHNFTGGVYGKGKEAEMEMIATLENFAALGGKYYVPFLTQKEFDGVVNDTDIWLHPDDIRARLDKMVKIQEKEMKKAQA